MREGKRSSFGGKSALPEDGDRAKRAKRKAHASVDEAGKLGLAAAGAVGVLTDSRGRIAPAARLLLLPRLLLLEIPRGVNPCHKDNAEKHNGCEDRDYQSH